MPDISYYEYETIEECIVRDTDLEEFSDNNNVIDYNVYTPENEVSDNSDIDE